ncbi:hypothetical protein FBY22_8785 [Streptomyces sp. SLBN-31]|nr:hypothetical protein FBY22_8785 [Streptomyces sp. SLBN-31]
MQQLGGISGVGEKKLVTYGEGVLAVLASLGGAPGAAPAADTGPSAEDDWPEMEEEPEPDDWM